MVSFSPEEPGLNKKRKLNVDREPFVPGARRRDEVPPQTSISEIKAQFDEKEQTKKIKKLARKTPPIAFEITKERDRRLGEKE